MKKTFLSKPAVIRDSLALVKEADVEHNIRVMPYLRDLIPPLTAEELTGLEESIRQEGVKDALTLWETTLSVLTQADEGLVPPEWKQEALNEPEKKIYILVDGHNRYRIARKLNESFRWNLRDFASLEEVRDYMVKYQLSRRNLTPLQAASMRGLLYLSLKRELGRPKTDETSLMPQPETPASGTATENGQPVSGKAPQGTSARAAASSRRGGAEEGKTADRLAGEFGVSGKTILRDAEFRRGLERLTPDLQHQVTSGKLKINKSDVANLADRPDVTGQIDSAEKLLSMVGMAEAAPVATPQKSAAKDSPFPEGEADRTRSALTTLEQNVSRLLQTKKETKQIRALRRELTQRLTDLLDQLRE